MTLVEIGRRWTGWIDASFPDAEVIAEVPIAWNNDEAQVVDGWIHARIVLPGGGHILVDHKSYPGTDPIGHIRQNYLGRLETYSRALAPVATSFPDARVPAVAEHGDCGPNVPSNPMNGAQSIRPYWRIEDRASAAIYSGRPASLR